MKKRWWFLIGFVVFLVILNFALEPVAKHYVNKALGDLKGYEGEVQDIDIALWRGAYRIDSLDIRLVDSVTQEQSPFFSVGAIDISIQWAALFKGAIVGEFVVTHPVINFVVQPSGEVSDGGENDWVQTVQDLIPIQINRFEIIDGEVHYKDPISSPNIDIAATELNALALNLSNADDSGEKLPSDIKLSTNTSGNGHIDVQMKMNALKEIPDFDLALELEGMDLVYLKDFTEAYGNLNFEKGTLYVSSEVAMDEGKYKGYVKPILKDFKIVDLSDKEQSLGNKMWEMLVGGVMKIFQNQKKDQFATRVPFEGDVSTSNVNIWRTIGNVFRNAFVDAFRNQVEGTVDLETVEKDEKVE